MYREARCRLNNTKQRSISWEMVHFVKYNGGRIKKIGLVVDENVLKALQLETKLFDELFKGLRL